VLFHNEKESGRTMARRQVNFWRNHQKTIAGVKMSQAKPHAEHPPSPTPQSIGGFWWRVFHVVEQNTPRKDAKKYA